MPHLIRRYSAGINCRLCLWKYMVVSDLSTCIWATTRDLNIQNPFQRNFLTEWSARCVNLAMVSKICGRLKLNAHAILNRFVLIWKLFISLHLKAVQDEDEWAIVRTCPPNDLKTVWATNTILTRGKRAREQAGSPWAVELQSRLKTKGSQLKQVIESSLPSPHYWKSELLKWLSSAFVFGMLEKSWNWNTGRNVAPLSNWSSSLVSNEARVINCSLIVFLRYFAPALIKT